MNLISTPAPSSAASVSRRTFLQATSATLGAAVLGCSNRREALPNLLMIVVDTVRQDYLGCYGQPQALTPGIDKFANAATRYTRAFASAPWTLGSHGSMFTGKFPFEHGAHFYDWPVLGNGRNMLPLDDEFETLAEFLKKHGYHTAVISANHGFITKEMGMAQGVEHFDSKYALAPNIVDRVNRWFDTRDSRPFFLYINFMDAHWPYNSAAVDRLGAPAIEDPIGRTEFERINLQLLNEAPGDLLELIKNRYRLGVAHTDDGVSAVLDEVSRRKLFDETAIFVVSDHGEFLGDHGYVGHGRDVYQETTHVPLLIKAVGQISPHVQETPVSLSYMPALVCRHLPDRLRELADENFGTLELDSPILMESYYCGMRFLRMPEFGTRFQRYKRAILDWPYKYFHSSDGQHELYHLGDDPGEQINLLDTESVVVARLHAKLDALLASRPHAPPPIGREVELDEQHREELETLAYL